MSFWDFGWPILTLAVAIAIYVFIVRPKSAETNLVLGKVEHIAEQTGWFKWFSARIAGWKTPILALMAGFPQLFQLIDPATLLDLQNAPWGVIFSPKVAGAISLACMLFIPITNAFGMNTAAKTVPRDLAAGK
jgi:hypothetical protein